MGLGGVRDRRRGKRGKEGLGSQGIGGGGREGEKISSDTGTSIPREIVEGKRGAGKGRRKVA